RFLRHEGPFETRGEAGAAAAAQARFLDLVDDPVAAPEQQLLGAVPVAALAGGVQLPALEAVEVGENAVLVLQHQPWPSWVICFKVVGPPTGADVWRSICGPGLGFSPRFRLSMSRTVLS